MKRLAIVVALFILRRPLSADAQIITIPAVTVGNPGNAADKTGYGTVNYIYNIGTYDVTLDQYDAFLNAVAATDPYSLYNPSLGTNMNVAGISRSGSSGSYTYSVIGDGNRPVTYVSWFDAARFTNWLTNGQPTGAEGPGTTETGAYTLNGAMSGIITKNSGAIWWIPSEDEWYKAAYYDPALNGGTGGYWLYPTRSNSQPGNVVGSSPNQANYYNGVYSVTQNGTRVNSQNYLTPVGAFSGSASAYGTYDQGGNVYQWNDYVYGGRRGWRGGYWDFVTAALQSSYRGDTDPMYGFDAIGFRVAARSEVMFNIQSISQGQNDLIVNFQTAPNATVQVQAKSSLVNAEWTTIASATADANGALQVTDPNSSNQPTRCYRASYPVAP